jgi:hypothetical protein
MVLSLLLACTPSFTLQTTVAMGRRELLGGAAVIFAQPTAAFAAGLPGTETIAFIQVMQHCLSLTLLLPSLTS